MKKDIPINKAHRLINTGCVLLVTSAYGDRKNIMTLAWQTLLSADPTLIGIAVAKPHFTRELIEGSKEFGLNIPGLQLLKQVNECGAVTGREIDKFKQTKLKPMEGQRIGIPLIEECIGHIECKLVDQHVLGDHMFFVGEVVAASAREDLFVASRWTKEASLLHHLGGGEYYINGKNYSSE